VVTYKAVLIVDNKDLLLRPGMTATAQIVTQEVENALSVPNAAFRFAPPRQERSQGFSVTNLFIPRMPPRERGQAPSADGERTIHVLENGTPKPVKVMTGVSDGKLTEIVSGELREGDEVIVSSKAVTP
jgi:HlyD family secretion protein